MPLSQFNPATGILLGARFAVSVPVSVTVGVAGTRGAGGALNVDATARYTGAVTGPGGLSIAGTELTATRSCNGGNCTNSPGNSTTTTSGTIAGSAAVNAASLAAYRGTGSINLATEGSLSAIVTSTGNVASNTATATASRGASSSYSVTYDYLNFAQPSFSGSSVLTTTTLDFGARGPNSSPVVLTFTLFNIGNNNSAGFDLLSITNTNTLFTTTLLPFSGAAGNIDGGQSRTFSVTLTPPSTLGAQVDNFRLLLKDSAVDVGGGIGAREYELSFNTAAFIVLPEPGTWASMIIGFGFIGAAARRRRGAAIRA